MTQTPSTPRRRRGKRAAATLILALAGVFALGACHDGPGKKGWRKKGQVVAVAVDLAAAVPASVRA